MTFTQAARHVQQRLLLLRCLAWLRRSQYAAAPALLLLALLRYTQGISFTWLLLALLLSLRADTLCLHGDRADAVEFALAVRALLEELGVAVRSPPRSSP